jgi:hypothetical protein
VLKELVDNSLDACETAGVPPEITVTVGDVGAGLERADALKEAIARGASTLMWSTQFVTNYDLTWHAGRGVWVTEDCSAFDGSRLYEYARGNDGA